MTTYSVAAPETRVPMRTLVLPPHAFATKWKQAPRANVTIGLTLVSSADVETAKSAAGLEAWRICPHDQDVFAREDIFNDLLVRWLIARGTCDPIDATRPVPIWKEAPEDIIREALSFEGVKMVWDALDRLWTESSPVLEEIDDDGMEELLAIHEQALAAMPPLKAKRVRRLLAACLEELRDFVGSED